MLWITSQITSIRALNPPLHCQVGQIFSINYAWVSSSVLQGNAQDLTNNEPATFGFTYYDAISCLLWNKGDT